MKTSSAMLVISILESEIYRYQFVTNNGHDLDTVTISINDNKLIINNKELYFENRNEVTIPPILKDFFSFEFKNGEMIAILNNFDLDSLMKYFQLIYGRNKFF